MRAKWFDSDVFRADDSREATIRRRNSLRAAPVAKYLRHSSRRVNEVPNLHPAVDECDGVAGSIENGPTLVDNRSLIRRLDWRRGHRDFRGLATQFPATLSIVKGIEDALFRSTPEEGYCSCYVHVILRRGAGPSVVCQRHIGSGGLAVRRRAKGRARGAVRLPMKYRTTHQFC